MDSFALYCIALIIGFLCGCTSIGGLLLIPAIVAFTDLSLYSAMATTLFSFIFTSVIGTVMHARNKTVDWRCAIVLGLGALLFAAFGAVAKQYLSTMFLSVMLGGLIILAGMNTLCPISALRWNLMESPRRQQDVILFFIGGFVGFIAGMTGAGGPVLSVPIMIALGYAPIVAVAVAQPFQLFAALSAAVGNIALGVIDYDVAWKISVIQVIGTAIGVRVAYCLNIAKMRIIVAAICILSGIYTLIKAF